MRIGIGSKNKAKVLAVKSAFGRLAGAFSRQELTDAEFLSIATRTSVPDMPLSLEQIAEGAIERAHFTFEHLDGLDFAIGMEGGTFPFVSPSLHGKPQFFLLNFVYVFDGRKGHLGSSPAVNLPSVVVQALYEQNRELAEVMDALTGKSDVRSNEGAFGVFTHDLLTRSASFEIAVINAMVPFLNVVYDDGKGRD